MRLRESGSYRSDAFGVNNLPPVSGQAVIARCGGGVIVLASDDHHRSINC
jgi:hypothetical protein